MSGVLDSQKEPRPKDCSETDLNEVVKQTCVEFSARTEAAGVTLSVLYSPANAVITGSRRNIARAVKHLILNAIVFNRQGGKVQVEVARTERDTSVTVSDTGIGIPKDLISGLGNPFYQIADYMTRKTGGLGLGLAIVKHVAEAHKGSLAITSVPGQGTVFTLTFRNINPCLVELKK